jgi:hypothetical protein
MNTSLLQAGTRVRGAARPGQQELDAALGSGPDRSRLRRVAAGVAALTAAVLAAGCVAPPRHAYAHNEVSRTAPPSPPPMYFYPERQQNEVAQDRDRFECYRWASRESGVDPGMTPVRQEPPQRVASARADSRADPRDGAPVVVGAMTGAAIGAMSSPHHPGDNAVIGAIFGAALGAIAQESRAQAIEQSQSRHQQAAQSAAQASAMPFDNFRRAMSACMTGRGYRVG